MSMKCSIEKFIVNFSVAVLVSTVGVLVEFVGRAESFQDVMIRWVVYCMASYGVLLLVSPPCNIEPSSDE